MKMTSCKKLLHGVLISLGTLLTAGVSPAQSTPTTQSPMIVERAPSLDLGVTYVAERTKFTYGNSFWLQGGSGELAFRIHKGFSLAVSVTGAHKGDLSPTNSGFRKLSYVAGPRYTFGLHKSRLFVEVLFGGVYGFDGTFPALSGTSTSANGFATQIGGGYDIDWKRHVSFRPIDVSFVHTNLSNGGSNSQNDLRLAAGIVFRFPKR